MPPRPTPRPTNLDEIKKDSHRAKLRRQLKAADEQCTGQDYQAPNRPKKEQGHHIINLGFAGMGGAMEPTHQILSACDIDIDDPENGVCMDDPSHNQTKRYKLYDPESYLSQVIRIFDATMDTNKGIDCDEVERRLALLKQHLANQNQISQSGGTPNVDLGSITF